MTDDIWAGLPDRYYRGMEIKELDDIELPKIEGWTDDPELQLMPFQRIGAAWMYVTQRSMLTDKVGLGKTIQTLAMICLLRQRQKPYRTIVICPKPARHQWVKEIRRFTNLAVMEVSGTKGERAAQYSGWWEVLVTTWPLLLRDYAVIKDQSPDVLVADEASAYRHHKTKTARMFKALARDVTRVIPLDATPIQKSLLDLHSLLEAFHLNIFGPIPAFERRFVRREKIKFRRGRATISTSKIIGYRNMGEFKKRIKPFLLRRSLEDVDAQMPELMPPVNVWLELPPAQRTLYRAAKQGMLEFWAEGRRMKMRSHFHHLQQACDSTFYFDRISGVQREPISVKLDWLINELTNSLDRQKVVVFAKYLATVDDIMRRLEEAGVRAYRFTGTEKDDQRTAALDAFWNDPKTYVLVGTTAIERALNLQKSAYLINVNQLWNPQRMEQLLGRIRRFGSEHARVVVVNLLCSDTVEQKMQKILSERAAVADYVFNETNELFEALTDEQLIALIQD